MSKRAREAYPASYAAALKRRKISRQKSLAVQYGFRPAPVARAPMRSYINRTPGGQITADNHYFDAEKTVTNIAATLTAWTGSEYDPATLNTLFAPQLGDDISNRAGRKCYVKKIRINGIINCDRQVNQTVADAPATVRLLLVQDMQTNSTQAQGEDVLESGTASDAIDMFQNLKNLGRFKVWKDKTFILQNPNMATDGANQAMVQGLARKFKFTIKPNCWVNFNATNGGTVADIVDHSWHIIANTTSTTMVPSITYKVRTVFSP